MFEPSAEDLAFFDQTFNDALSVIEETRDSIMSGVARGEGFDLLPEQKMHLSQELSRLTSRAASAMSLLLMYKAIITNQADEIDNIPTRLDELYSTVRAAEPADQAAPPALPEPVEALRAKAEALFTRIDTIYHMIGAQIAN